MRISKEMDDDLKALIDIINRPGSDIKKTATLIGYSDFTLRRWVNGDRIMPEHARATVRILETISVIVPDVLDTLLGD